MESKVILKIVARKNSSDCRIFFSEDEVFECSMDIVLKYQLTRGREIDSKLLQAIRAEQTIYNIKKVAFTYASYKPRTEKQVLQKLKDKGFSPEYFPYAIEFLMEFRLLDDFKFACSFVKDYLLRKSAGKSRIRLELLKKGIAPAIADSALDHSFPADNNYSLASKAADKKLRLSRNKPYDKQKASLINYLLSMGFEWDLIKKITAEKLKKPI